MQEIFIILGLILLNGVFSMAEIALVSSRRARLESQANKGDTRAKEALELASHPDKFLSTVQIGITLIGILTGIYSGENLKSGLVDYLKGFELTRDYSNGIATTIIVVSVTYFSLVLGELIPKRLGLSRPEAIAKLVAAPMRIVSIVTYPFIWLLTKSTYLLTTLFRIQGKDNMVTEEEIKAIISEGTEQGAIEEAEQEIIERVFHLGDRNITSIMTHRSDIIWFDVSDNEASIREKIMREPHSAYPICEGSLDNVKGLISLKDIYVTDDLTVFKQVMKPALFVPENITAYTVLEKFKQHRTHTCFIVDEYGSLQGMITLNDILEAIVGELPQTDVEDYEIVKREDGSYLVDGQIPFYDFLSFFAKTEWMNEGEQEFDTLAGFILHKLERIPHTGDFFDWQGFRIEIVDMDAQRIDKVLVNISDTLRQEMDE
ncbi:MAG: hemolysin family protein [Candidatus Pseudobacter hemicellulosilyticus]|uniref:Hemolysin family protein n=1 Tax=Candidatus Pseudobacter hemicellulosilyticus TaxID=3121375 RepID=A0AAJ5WRI4_9BACT|nr:MAG: hemolysin family protein [Pseudobacter sp.]